MFTNIEGLQHADDSLELKTHFESVFQSLSNAIERAHADGQPTIAQELAKLYGLFCNAFEAGMGRKADFYRGNTREAYQSYL